MSFQSAQAFTAQVAASPELQAQLRSIQSPFELIAIAQAQGFDLTPEDLGAIAQAAYQHWIEQLTGNTKRFFEQVQANTDWNNRLKICRTPAEAIGLAADLGVAITEADLREAARAAARVQGFSFEKLWFRQLGMGDG